MSRFRALLDCGLLQAGDEIQFDYKEFTFAAVVAKDGMLHGSKCKEGDDLTPILNDKTFKTLSLWADTCIREHRREYGTRYSAWKRSRHVRTGLKMEELYSTYQSKVKDETVNAPVERAKEQKDSVKPVLLNSPYGAYLILQRIYDVDPSSAELLKKNGLFEFRKMVQDFVKRDNGKLYARYSDDDFVNALPKQSNTYIANYVYDFFKT